MNVRQWLVGWIAGASVLFCGVAHADPADERLRFAFTTRLRGGLVQGQLQTPKGGGATTTSWGRPRLEELGVDTAWAPGARLGVLWRRHRAYLDYEQIQLRGSGTLREDLVTQGDFYPAGTRIRSTTFIVRASAGYRHTFSFPLGTGTLEVAPGAGYSIFGFRYRVRGSNGQNAHRFYTDTVPHVDVALQWRPHRTSRWWFSGEARQSLPFLLSGGRITDLFEVFGRMHVDVNRQWSAFVGVGYQHLFKRDAQTTPNRPHIDFGPFLEVGFTFRF